MNSIKFPAELIPPVRITELHQILDMSVCPQEGSVLEARPVAGGLILEMRKRDQRNPETAPNLRHLRVSTAWLQLLPPSTASCAENITIMWC